MFAATLLLLCCEFAAFLLDICRVFASNDPIHDIDCELETNYIFKNPKLGISN
jgi:hypothetical protein